MLPSIRTVLLRDLGTVRAELELYENEADLWKEVPGQGTCGGTLALHLAGNLQHFIGAVLGGTGYVRDRDAEFSRRGVARAELLKDLLHTEAVVDQTLASLTEDSVQRLFPVPFGDRVVGTEVFLIHLCAHLGYHLGQLDYHRRAATGSTASAKAQSVPALAR